MLTEMCQTQLWIQKWHMKFFCLLIDTAICNSCLLFNSDIRAFTSRTKQLIVLQAFWSKVAAGLYTSACGMYQHKSRRPSEDLEESGVQCAAIKESNYVFPRLLLVKTFGGGARDFTEWLVIFTNCFCQQLVQCPFQIQYINHSTSQQNCYIYHLRFRFQYISCHYANALYLTKWKIMATSVNLWQESVKLLCLQTCHYFHGLYLTEKSSFNVGKIMVLCFTILLTYFFFM